MQRICVLPNNSVASCSLEEEYGEHYHHTTRANISTKTGVEYWSLWVPQQSLWAPTLCSDLQCSHVSLSSWSLFSWRFLCNFIKLSLLLISHIWSFHFKVLLVLFLQQEIIFFQLDVCIESRPKVPASLQRLGFRACRLLISAIHYSLLRSAAIYCG